jgi:Anti-repressor SinI
MGKQQDIQGDVMIVRIKKLNYDWIQLVQLAIESGITKEQFKEFIEKKKREKRFLKINR